jgi:SAM-dependent methyltransferase
MNSAHQANRRYFRDAYRRGEHGWAVEKPSPYVLRYLRRLRRAAPGARLLDLGCGEGRHSIAAARLGFAAVGVDAEPLALARARAKARRKRARGVSLRRADALRLPFPAASFDVVLDYGCLHHQRKADWPAYRAELLRVLRPGGYFVLSVFSPRFRMFKRTRRSWHITRGAYRRCFTAEEIAALFAPELEVLALAEQRGRRGGFWHALLRKTDPGSHTAAP